jgi:hypothetical protein
MTRLDDLIQRLTWVVNNTEMKSVVLHWSDVELLRAVQAELVATHGALDAAHRALDAAIKAVLTLNKEDRTP